jgi:hypothetical protein
MTAMVLKRAPEQQLRTARTQSVFAGLATLRENLRCPAAISGELAEAKALISRKAAKAQSTRTTAWNSTITVRLCGLSDFARESSMSGRDPRRLLRRPRNESLAEPPRREVHKLQPGFECRLTWIRLTNPAVARASDPHSPLALRERNKQPLRLVARSRQQ